MALHEGEPLSTKQVLKLFGEGDPSHPDYIAWKDAIKADPVTKEELMAIALGGNDTDRDPPSFSTPPFSYE